MCMAILIFLWHKYLCFLHPKNGKFSQLFFPSVNSINFANLLGKKNAKIFKIKRLIFLIKKKKKEKKEKKKDILFYFILKKLFKT